MALIEDVATVIERFPTKFRKLEDQLIRSAESISAQFGEGYKRRSLADRRRYFDASSGSSREVSAHIDAALRFKVVTPDLHKRIKQRCDYLCAMLYKFR
jgi:four helix bundle protein